MRILGLRFAGTSTPQRAVMTEFMSSVLGADSISVDGLDADLFQLPDGSTFAVASPQTMGETERSLGFIVDNLDLAVADLHSHGVDTDDIASNDIYRYVHFTAPDGNVYELVEERNRTQVRGRRGG